MRWLTQVRNAALTALVVFVSINLLVQVITPFVPILLALLAVYAAGYLVYLSRRL